MTTSVRTRLQAQYNALMKALGKTLMKDRVAEDYAKRRIIECRRREKGSGKKHPGIPRYGLLINKLMHINIDVNIDLLLCGRKRLDFFD